MITFVVGDLTERRVDAIVNAANEALAPDGGVSGAIRRAGGDEIFDECARLGGCATGDAKATSAGRLPARYVIHAVGGTRARLLDDRLSGAADGHLRGTA